MFSSRIFWTTVVAYLTLAALAGWGFSSIGGGAMENTDAAVSKESPRLIWGAALTVALIGILLTGSILRMAARRLSDLTEIVASAEAAAIGTAASARDGAADLESAIDSTTRRLRLQIDELQRTGRQLQESTERLETVLGSMVEGVVAVDERQRILFANRAARALFDMHGPSDVGRPIWELIRHAQVDGVIRGVLAGEPTPRFEEIDLPRKHAVVAVIASRLPGHPNSGAVIVFHDVTELRRLENVRREFVSNVSHELRTPLTAIQAYTETLLDGALDEAEHRRPFVERIAEQANRLHALIQDVLQLARIESGRDVFEVRRVAIAPIVAECIDAHSSVSNLKGQRLFAAPPPADVDVLADESGLRTILSNLIDNAVKYTQEQGEIVVRWHAAGGMGVIAVQDDGPGIAPENQARIFERFYRVDKARSQAVEGTGLGLSIVKHLAQAFGGNVDVHSQAGQGATFVVRLPLA